MLGEGKLYENQRPDLSGIEQPIFDSIKKNLENSSKTSVNYGVSLRRRMKRRQQN
jgi:hypothetical protein